MFLKTNCIITWPHGHAAPVKAPDQPGDRQNITIIKIKSKKFKKVVDKWKIV